MAILACLQKGVVSMGKILFVGGLTLLVACSGTPEAPQVESGSLLEAPTITGYRVESEATWSVGVSEAPVAPDDRLLYLVPASSVGDFDAEATLTRAEAGSEPQYSVSLRWLEGHLSVSARQAVRCYPTGGLSWTPVEIRGVDGCEATNEAGLYFAKWAEGGTEYHYESFDIVGAEARDVLAGWEPLEYQAAPANPQFDDPRTAG